MNECDTNGGIHGGVRLRSRWYAILNLSGEEPDASFVPLRYDHERLASEMRGERIAEPFVRTIETGWWTTCLEILPAKERARGLH